jgi:hypothetical protein
LYVPEIVNQSNPNGFGRFFSINGP